MNTNLLLILFFASLISIIVMIGRRLVLLKKEGVTVEEKITFEVPNLEKFKYHTIAGIKKCERIALVEILRLYLKGTNFLKNKYQVLKIKIQSFRKVRHLESQKKEISKFLKVIGDYKRRIREITHKIKREEDL